MYIVQSGVFVERNNTQEMLHHKKSKQKGQKKKKKEKNWEVDLSLEEVSYVQVQHIHTWPLQIYSTPI